PVTEAAAFGAITEQPRVPSLRVAPRFLGDLLHWRGELFTLRFEVAQDHHVRVSRRDRLFAAAVGPLQDALDTLHRVRHQVRVNLQLGPRRIFDRVFGDVDFERPDVGEDLARGHDDLFPVGMHADRLFYGVARVRAERRDALLAVFDRSDG